MSRFSASLSPPLPLCLPLVLCPCLSISASLFQARLLSLTQSTNLLTRRAARYDFGSECAKAIVDRASRLKTMDNFCLHLCCTLLLFQLIFSLHFLVRTRKFSQHMHIHVHTCAWSSVVKKGRCTYNNAFIVHALRNPSIYTPSLSSPIHAQIMQRDLSLVIMSAAVKVVARVHELLLPCVWVDFVIRRRHTNAAFWLDPVSLVPSEPLSRLAYTHGIQGICHVVWPCAGACVHVFVT